jgi:hypothetical protein
MADESFQGGVCVYRNPINHAQLCKVTLTPENIECIVFWTKDPAPMLSRLKELDTLGYQYYFQFTITPYGLPYRGTELGRYLEPNLRIKERLFGPFRNYQIDSARPGYYGDMTPLFSMIR